MGRNNSFVGRISSPVGWNSSPVGQNSSLVSSSVGHTDGLGAFGCSGDAPGSSKARIFDFSLVLGGFGGGEAMDAPWTCRADGVWLRLPEYKFSRQTKHQWVWARVWAMAKANGPGLGCLGINAHSHPCAKRDGG